MPISPGKHGEYRIAIFTCAGAATAGAPANTGELLDQHLSNRSARDMRESHDMRILMTLCRRRYVINFDEFSSANDRSY